MKELIEKLKEELEAGNDPHLSRVVVRKEYVEQAIEALQPPPGFEEWVDEIKFVYDEPECPSDPPPVPVDAVLVEDLHQYFATLSTYDAEKEVAVPIEPTDEMIDMGCETGAGHYRADVLLIYTAMLKASKPEDA